MKKMPLTEYRRFTRKEVFRKYLVEKTKAYSLLALILVLQFLGNRASASISVSFFSSANPSCRTVNFSGSPSVSGSTTTPCGSGGPYYCGTVECGGYSDITGWHPYYCDKTYNVNYAYFAYFVWNFGDGTTTSSSSYGITHTYSAAGTYTVILTGYDNFGNSNSYTANVTVTDTAGAVTGPSTVCQGSSVTLSRSYPGGTWSTSNTHASIDASGHVLGISAGATTVSYTLPGGCFSTKPMIVNPLPVAGSITGTSSIYVGSTISLAASGDAGGTWSASSSKATVSSSGVVSGVANGTATISYTVTNSCGVSVATSDITIAIPVLPISGIPSLCAGGGTTTLSDSTVGGTWSSSDSSVATVSTSGVVTGVVAGTAIISYAVAGSTVTKIVTVNALPNAGTISGSASVCEASSILLSDSTFGGTWSSSNPAIAAVDSTGMVAGVGVGSALIYYTVHSICGTAETSAFMMVNSLPAVSPISGPSSTCAGTSIFLNDSTFGGTWSSSNPAAVAVDSMGMVSGLAIGSAIIYYTVTGVCGSSTASAFVMVNPAATVSPISGSSSVCEGASIFLSDSTAGGTWNSSNPGVITVDSMGMVVGVGAGSALIYYTVHSICGSAETSALVMVNPAATVFPISGPSSVCMGTSIFLTDSTAGGTWSSSNPAVANVDSMGMVTGVAPGSAIIYYTVMGVCGSSTASAFVTVNPMTIVSPISGASSVCEGATIALTEMTSGGYWISNAPSVASVNDSGMATGITSGSAIISYIVESSCGGGIVTKVVMVDPLPAMSVITGVSTVNIGSIIALAATPAGGTWASSAATIAAVDSGGVVSGLAGGVVVISYTMSNSCGVSIATKLVTVNSVPSISGTLTVCAGNTTNLSASIPGGTWSSSNTSRATVSPAGIVSGLVAGTVFISYSVSGSVSMVIVTVNTTPSVVGTASICTGTTATLSGSAGGAWSSLDSGIASVGGTGIVTGNAPGTTTIEYTLSNGCKVTRVATVNVFPEAIDGPTSVCVGTTMTLTNSVSGGTWSSSNIWQATVGTAGNVTGVAVGTPVITYAIGVCKVTQTVNVLSSPAVVGGTAKVCPGTTATLTNATAGGVWSSSDPSLGTVSTGGVVTGVAAGTVNIFYTMTNGCSKSATATINANPAEITGTTTICAGATTSLFSATAGLQWSSSDASKATVNSVSGVVTGVAAGTAKITYKNTTTGCLTTTVVAVSASPASIGGTQRACPGATTSLTNATTGGAWSSSDPTIATIGTNGVVSGLVAGTTTIEYSIGGGCSRSVIVTINSAPAISGSLGVCLGKSTMLTSSPAASSWVSSNPAVATVGSGSVAGMTAGTADITVTVGTGCKAVVNVTVNALPPAISGTLATCVGSTTTLSNAMSGGTWSSYAPSFASINSSGVVTGIVVSNVMITYTSSVGCIRTGALTVNAAPVISGTASMCEGASVTLSAPGGGTWSSSTVSRAIVGSTGIVTGVSAGNATISYTSPIGCQASRVVTVNVCSSRQAITGVGATELNTQIMLFPNPTNGMVTFQASESGTLSVLAVDGKEVASYQIKEGDTNIDLPNDLAAGVYMCRFNGNEGSSAMVRLIYQP